MAKTISSLSVVLSATATPFVSAFAKAGSVADSTRHSIVNIGSAMTKVGALASLAAGAWASIGVASFVKAQAEAIDINAKLADRIGMTTEALSGLQYAGDLAGVSGEQLTGALEKMLKSLSATMNGSSVATDAFSSLGLSAQALANTPADQAFGEIAQRISQIENPAQRAGVAMEIFGKAGQSLLPLLMTGVEGIAAAQEEAKKLGLTFTRVDAAKVEQANDAMTRLSSVFTGAGRQIAIGIAPYIEGVAVQLTGMITTGEGIGPKIGRSIEWVASALAQAADYLQLFPMGFHGFRAGALQAIASVVGGLDSLGGGLTKVLNLLPGVEVEWTDTFANLVTGLEKEAADEAAKFDAAFRTFNNGENSKNVTAFFDGIKAQANIAAAASTAAAAKAAEAFSKIGKGGGGEGGDDIGANFEKVGVALADLQLKVTQFGMTDIQKKIIELRELGASANQLAAAGASMQQFAGLEQAERVRVAIEDLNNQVADFGMTDIQRKLAELKALGATAIGNSGCPHGNARLTRSHR